MSSTEKLRSSTTLQRLVGLWRWIPAAQVFYADAAICTLFGIDPVIGRAGESIDRFARAIHRDERETVLQRIGVQVAAGLDFAERYRLVDAERRSRSVLTIGWRYDSAVPDEISYVGALFGQDDLPAEASPPHAAIIDHLMAAKGLADLLSETMLAKLIEAILLEAGRSYANAIRHDGHGLP